MRNLSNLLAVFALVAMMGLLVGCGCGTTNTPAEDNMVDNTTEETVPPADTAEEPLNQGSTEHITNPNQTTESIVDDNGNLIENNTDGTSTNPNNNAINTDANGNTTNDTNASNAGNTAGNVVDDAGNIVGDVIEDAGDAVQDVGRGVNRMADDTAR